MFDPVTAGIVVGGAVLGGSLLSADAQRSSTNKAIDAQNAATDKSLDLQKYMYDKGIELNKPFYEPVTLGHIPDYLVSAVTGQPSNGYSYDYTKSPNVGIAGREMMRGLGARGLAGSGLAPYKLGELASADYDKQIGRLSGLVDMARGTSNIMTNLGTNYANSGSALYNQSGENIANALLAQGKNTASLYSGMGQMPLNLAALYTMGGGKW